MRSAAAGQSERLYAAFGRFVLISIGVFAVCWGIITFPVVWRDASLDLKADRMLDVQQFNHEILQKLLAGADSAKRTWVRPHALRGAAVIWLQLAEQARKLWGQSRPVLYLIN